MLHFYSITKRSNTTMTLGGVILKLAQVPTAPIPRLVQPIPQPPVQPPVKHPRSPNPRLLQGACGSIPWVSPPRSIRRVGAAGRGVGPPLGFHERSIPNPMTSSHATAAPVQYGASGGPHEALQRVTHQVKPPYTCAVVSLSECGPCGAECGSI